MVCRLIDFVLVIFKLLMVKACGIIGISEIKCFNFSGTERVKDVLFHFLQVSVVNTNFRTLLHLVVVKDS